MPLVAPQATLPFTVTDAYNRTGTARETLVRHGWNPHRRRGRHWRRVHALPAIRRSCTRSAGCVPVGAIFSMFTTARSTRGSPPS